MIFAVGGPVLAEEKAGADPEIEVVDVHRDESDYLPKLRLNGKLVDGVPDGEFTLMDASGKKVGVENYRNGKEHGTFVYFYPNGNVFSEIDFVNGVQHGEQKDNYPDGTPSTRVTYVKGKAHGDSEIYFINGRLRSTCEMKMGVQHGESKSYTKDGRLAAIGLFRDGELIESQEIVSTVGPETDYRALCDKYKLPLKEFWKHPEKMKMPEDKERFPTLID